MSEWITFENATYLVEQAFLIADDKTATALDKTVVTVYTGSAGKKQLNGTGIVQNFHMVELMENSEDLDLILDFGGEFKYLLKTPEIAAGKVFSPTVKSHLRFAPATPWHRMTESEFETLKNELKFL
ncbi:MAG: hypothetical protein JRF27_06145 [Deltaproteobacteria bacterium]|nr:hypothetical protein [Deltaproteobacteria bacterium]MBW2193352.1 hypothetical protein [Deltaproteobacteria bacterium]